MLHDIIDIDSNSSLLIIHRGTLHASGLDCVRSGASVRWMLCWLAIRITRASTHAQPQMVLYLVGSPSTTLATRVQAPRL